MNMNTSMILDDIYGTNNQLCEIGISCDEYINNMTNDMTTGIATDALTGSNDFRDYIDYETAVIISTHLIPSHPKLDIIKETVDSLNHLIGLPKKSQIILTVDGLNENTPENRKSYHLLKTPANKNKLKSYIEALKKQYGHLINVRIMVSDKHRHLGENLQNAVELLDEKTEFAYILQQDLPFTRDINHTAIVKTRREYPEYIRLIRFNNRQSRILKNSPCWNQTEPVQHINGIHLHRTHEWSDMDYWVDLKFYREEILAKIDLNNFPEVSMMSKARKNCSFYGPHMYGLPEEKAYVKHTDGAERYGKKLKARIANGDIKKEDLMPNTIREESIII